MKPGNNNPTTRRRLNMRKAWSLAIISGAVMMTTAAQFITNPGGLKWLPLAIVSAILTAVTLQIIEDEYKTR
jgi:hypothetical protein